MSQLALRVMQSSLNIFVVTILKYEYEQYKYCIYTIDGITKHFLHLFLIFHHVLKKI